MRIRQVYIAITEDELARLRELAERERRTPKLQAALLIAEGLRRHLAEDLAATVSPPHEAQP